MFIATANVVDTIPGPLLDRMEVIRLDGYTESEKVSIARHHLVDRQLGRAALREDEVQISDEALRTIVADYTREAGVRSLEREIGRLLRKVATKLAAGERQAPVVVDSPAVRGWLGRAHFYFEAAERTSVPGVVTGLAVTGAGGDVLFVEASMSDGPEGLTPVSYTHLDVYKRQGLIPSQGRRPTTGFKRVPKTTDATATELTTVDEKIMR